MNVVADIKSIFSRLFSFFTANLTRSTMALFGFISFIAISWGTYDCVSMLNQKSAALANELETEKNTALMLEVVRLQQQVRIDVIQVQQLLLDYSTTRGQDGHNNVLHDAAKYAAKFPQDIGAARLAADALGDESLTSALTGVARIFPTYYERGVEMAKVYAAAGHSAGNKLMIEFSAQSDEIQKRLDEADSMLEALERSIASTATLANKRIREARDNQSLIALTGVLVTALTCLAGVFFAYYRVIQPLSWITNCFNRLEKNEFHLDVRESSRSDEIGALGRTYREFKQRALENRKTSLEAALLTQFNEWLHCCKSLDELYEVVAKHLAVLLPNCAGALYVFSNSRDALENVKAWSGSENGRAHAP